MKKPIIAVTALFDDEKDSIWMLPSYLDAITEAGGIPVILPLRQMPKILPWKTLTHMEVPAS